MNEGECEAQIIIPAGDVYKCQHDKGHSRLQPHRAILEACARSEINKLTETKVTIEWKDAN